VHDVVAILYCTASEVSAELKLASYWSAHAPICCSTGRHGTGWDRKYEREMTRAMDLNHDEETLCGTRFRKRTRRVSMNNDSAYLLTVHSLYYDLNVDSYEMKTAIPVALSLSPRIFRKYRPASHPLYRLRQSSRKLVP
jgi:hypothetical protein